MGIVDKEEKERLVKKVEELQNLTDDEAIKFAPIILGQFFVDLSENNKEELAYKWFGCIAANINNMLKLHPFVKRAIVYYTSNSLLRNTWCHKHEKLNNNKDGCFDCKNENISNQWSDMRDKDI